MKAVSTFVLALSLAVAGCLQSAAREMSTFALAVCDSGRRMVLC